MITRQNRKKEIAKALYPDSITMDSAMQRLRVEIRESEGLKEELEKHGSLRSHCFNDKQLRIILARFDITEERYNEMMQYDGVLQ